MWPHFITPCIASSGNALFMKLEGLLATRGKVKNRWIFYFEHLSSVKDSL